jgi:hypothetical protein
MLGSQTYDAVNQRFLRIRQTGNAFMLDTAPAAAGPYTVGAMSQATNVDLTSNGVRFGIAAISNPSGTSDTAGFASLAVSH